MSGESIAERLRFGQCIEEIMNYEYHHGVIKPWCYRDGDKFYFYVAGTAMGLIVDESGRLFPKTAIAPDGLWVGADSLLNILEKNLEKKEGKKRNFSGSL